MMSEERQEAGPGGEKWFQMKHEKRWNIDPTAFSVFTLAWVDRQVMSWWLNKFTLGTHLGLSEREKIALDKECLKY